MKDKYYYIGTNKANLHINTYLSEPKECNLYEITEDGDKLLTSISFSNVSEDMAWMICRAKVNSPLYEGKKYKLVIPEGYFTAYSGALTSQITDISKVNYIRNNELVYTFTGTTPTKVTLIDCTIKDNSVVSALYKLVWTFEGQYRLSDEINTIEESVTNSQYEGMKPTVTKRIPILSSSYGKTYLTLDYISNQTGQPKIVGSTKTYTMTIPKGMLVNVFNDELVNDEIVLTFKGGETEPEIAETVWVNMTINGLHTSSHQATKGKSYTFSLNPGTDWKVKSVKNGEDVVSGISTDKSNPNLKTYILSALKGDTNINAELEYDGQWAKEDGTTKVWTIEANNIRIYCDNNMIVVDGVTPENTISVYNVAGMFINTTHVSDGNDRVYISVPLNQTYIVSVDGVAAKIYVK